jgi:demethylspheroidene O-methyltransferase
MVAEEVLATYDFGRHRSLLDVGGGYGAFLSAVAAAYPHIQLGLFDLPSVLAGAKPRIATARIAERVDYHPGDFFADPIPSGYDCITLVRVLHDHDDDEVKRLLRNIRAGLAPGSRLMVAEPMARTRGAEAMGDAYFGLYLWAMNSGRPRTAREIVGLLDSSGFRRPLEVRTAQPLIARIIVADA